MSGGIASAFNAAMEAARDEDGPVDLEEAAARLAYRLGEDVGLRAEVAAFVLLHLLEPFGSVARAKFEELEGEPLEERVAEIRPAVGRIVELDDEVVEREIRELKREGRW